ncbi:MAG: CHAP domain-containing protein [Acidobacteria bacterium]|nr:CHAP domain-containing protein [Acidobacteriota bacterium]
MKETTLKCRTLIAALVVTIVMSTAGLGIGRTSPAPASGHAVVQSAVAQEVEAQEVEAAEDAAEPVVTTIEMAADDLPVEAILAEEPIGFTYVEGTEKIVGFDATFFRTVDGIGLAVTLANGRTIVSTAPEPASRDRLVETAASFINGSMDKVASCEQHACNCVLYARCRVPSLPGPLNTHQQKLDIINHQFPRVGSVAVHNINTSGAGHVSVVTAVAIRTDGNLDVTVTEANYQSCRITSRTGTPSSLKIAGYFDPAYSSGQSHPTLGSASPSRLTATRQTFVTLSGTNFPTADAQVMIFGGSCMSWGSCVVPRSSLQNVTSTRLVVPLTLNTRGTFHVYVYSPSTGKTSQGRKLTVR